MKGVQSLWTGTPMFQPTRNCLLLQTLSHCLTLEHFDEVELVTDNNGLFISEVLGWEYTSLVSRLDELTREGLGHIWATGKMMALLLQNKSSVHIDWDGLFFGVLPKRMRQGRLIAERVDNPDYYTSPDLECAIETLDFPKGMMGYNCGMVGGMDMGLVRKYAEGAISNAQKMKATHLNGTAVSMVCEQYWLGLFARENGVRVEPLLSAWSTFGEARRSKWFHLTGPIKHRPEVMVRVERRLARDYPKAYRKFLEGFPRVQREWNAIREGIYSS